uniref:BPI2 domain-containing protein n=1 Tax=Angiostrongylus cantonensis TaxID=6313 RepID=A0A0K0DCB6_ANGCA
MQILIAEFVYFLLIVTTVSTKISRSDYSHLENLSYESMETLVTELKREIKEHIDDEEARPKKWKTTTMSQLVIPEHINRDITLRIYQSGMKYLLEQVILAIRHDVMRHRPRNIRTSYHGMDINVDSIEIVDFLPPRLEVERLNASQIRFQTHGGGMRYLGLYSTIYKTTREGQFEALLDNVQVLTDIELLHNNNHIKVTERYCEAKFDEVLVQLTPTMPSQIIELLKERLQYRFHESLCSAIPHFAEKTASIITSIASIEDFTDHKEQLPPTCVLRYVNALSRLNSRGAKISFKRCIPRERRTTKDTATIDPEAIVESEMASISIREDYINEMFYDLKQSGNIVFHLHLVPDIEKMLSTHCDDHACLGHYMNLNDVINGTGHLDSHVISTPRIEIYHDHAILHLSLSTVLSFESRRTQRRISPLQFETVLCLQITELNVEFSEENGYYRWMARYEIVHTKTYDVHTDSEEVANISRDIEQHLNKQQRYLEDLLATHLNGELPLRLNPRVRLFPRPAIFRHHRIIIPMNFKFDKNLLPAFQFFSS